LVHSLLCLRRLAPGIPTQQGHEAALASLLVSPLFARHAVPDLEVLVMGSADRNDQHASFTQLRA
jgi:hypothetical protein